MEPILRHTETTHWLSLLVIGCIILLAVVKYFYPYRFQEFIKIPITDNYFLTQRRDDSLLHPFNVLLFILQVISFSIFIYLYFTLSFPEKVAANSWLFVQILILLSLFISFKVIAEKMIATIFNIEAIIDRYLYYKLTHRSLISIITLISCIAFLFVFPVSKLNVILLTSVIVALNAFSLYYSYKKFRNIILPHFFHFILYLCALEISPYIIIYQSLIYSGKI